MVTAALVLITALAWGAGYYADPMHQPGESPVHGRLIMTGVGSMEKPRAGERAVGLFRVKRGYWLGSVVTRIVRVQTQYGDEGMGIAAVGTLQPVFILKDHERLVNRSVKTVFDGNLELRPHSKLRLNLPSETVELEFQGNGKVEKTPFNDDVAVMQLSIRRGERSALLPVVNTSPSVGNSVHLLWAGDLEGDGHLDLLLQDFYDEGSSVRLFLSSPASDDALLVEVAQFDLYS